jgi:uncharacterized membrane protein YgcG
MIAYDKKMLQNLYLVKEVKQWMKDGYLRDEQFRTIAAEHPVKFYHPNLIIRILLFIATLIALGGVTGILILLFAEAMDDGAMILAFFYGIGSCVFLDMVFIRGHHHYKSGVTEALLYHSIGWTVAGFMYIFDWQIYPGLIFSLIVLAFCAIRYADLISTAGAVGVFAYLVFQTFYDMGDIMKFFVPFALIIIFTPVYFYVRSLTKKVEMQPWKNVILLTEALALLLIYAAGNYFVVRNATESLLDLYLEEGQDIPYAIIFYALTAIVPALYLYFGIRKKDLVLIRVSLVVIAFSVFTFKYYFSLGHPEVTLTLAGAILIAIAMGLFRYLQIVRSGFTRDNLIKEKWAGANPEAFVISQTLGGNKPLEGEAVEMGGGGQSGGGGSSDGW